MSPHGPTMAFINAGSDAATRLGYREEMDLVSAIMRVVYLGDEDRARRIWAAAFPHDPDSLAVIMADAREARAAAERRAAL